MVITAPKLRLSTLVNPNWRVNPIAATARIAATTIPSAAEASSWDIRSGDALDVNRFDRGNRNRAQGDGAARGRAGHRLLVAKGVVVLVEVDQPGGSEVGDLF